MQTVVTGLKVALGLAIAAFLGLHVSIRLLVGLMVADVVVGIIAAAITKTLSSDAMWKGLGKKAVIVFLVATGELIDHASGIGTFPTGLGELVAGFYCAHEGLSIVENAVTVGLPVPSALRDALAKLSPEKTNGGSQLSG